MGTKVPRKADLVKAAIVAIQTSSCVPTTVTDEKFETSFLWNQHNCKSDFPTYFEYTGSNLTGKTKAVPVWSDFQSEKDINKQTNLRNPPAHSSYYNTAKHAVTSLAKSVIMSASRVNPTTTFGGEFGKNYFLGHKLYDQFDGESPAAIVPELTAAVPLYNGVGVKYLGQYGCVYIGGEGAGPQAAYMACIHSVTGTSTFYIPPEVTGTMHDGTGSALGSTLCNEYVTGSCAGYLTSSIDLWWFGQLDASDTVNIYITGALYVGASRPSVAFHLSRSYWSADIAGSTNANYSLGYLSVPTASLINPGAGPDGISITLTSSAAGATSATPYAGAMVIWTYA